MDRFKARLVAMEDSQILRANFHETFSSVAKLNSVHIMISLAIHFDLGLFQLDVTWGSLQTCLYAIATWFCG